MIGLLTKYNRLLEDVVRDDLHHSHSEGPSLEARDVPTDYYSYRILNPDLFGGMMTKRGTRVKANTVSVVPRLRMQKEYGATSRDTSPGVGACASSHRATPSLWQG